MSVADIKWCESHKLLGHWHCYKWDQGLGPCRMVEKPLVTNVATIVRAWCPDLNDFAVMEFTAELLGSVSEIRQLREGVS